MYSVSVEDRGEEAGEVNRLVACLPSLDQTARHRSTILETKMGNMF